MHDAPRPGKHPRRDPVPAVEAEVKSLQALFFVSWLLVCNSPADEALHKGRPIHLWVNDLVSEKLEERISAEKELRVIGTNALPAMLSFVTSYGSAFSSHDSSVAYFSFQILGPTAAPAIPKLVQLANDPNYSSDATAALRLIGAKAVLPLASVLTNQNPKIRQDVLDALRHYGYDSNSIPNAQAALPAIRKCLADTNSIVAASARVTLVNLSTNMVQLVQDIIPSLQANSPDVRSGTANLLRILGPRAKSSIPALLSAANDEDKRVRDAVALAIQAVDPETAKKSGVKVPIYE